MTEDDLDFYYEQVVNIHGFGANATFDAIAGHLGGPVDRHLVQLAEGLTTLVERGRLERVEVDRKGRYAVGKELVYVPVRKTRS